MRVKFLFTKEYLFIAILASCFVVLLFWNLLHRPVFWDEGWTYSAAFNWLKTGVFAQESLGEISDVGLAAHPFLISLVTFSARIFGVGVWQARVPFALLGIFAIAALVGLALRIYPRRSVALGILSLMLLSHNVWVNPATAYHMVLAEIPMLLSLLVGYVFLARALGESKWNLLPSTFFFSLALTLKIQPLPFFVASCLGTSIFLMLRNDYRNIWPLLFVVLSSIILQHTFWIELFLLIYGSQFISVEPIPGLIWRSGLVFNPEVRIQVLFDTILNFWWLIIAFVVEAYWIFRLILRERGSKVSLQEILRVAFFCLSASWFIWFVFLSVGWKRYLLPINFMGCLYVGQLMNQVGCRYSWSALVRKFPNIFRVSRYSWPVASQCVLWLLLLWPFLLTLQLHYVLFQMPGYNHDSLKKVVKYINEKTPQDSIIEVYMPELFPFLERKYHFPPARYSIGFEIANKYGAPDYDLLKADPDYLIACPEAQEISRGMYLPVIHSGEFELREDFGWYLIYQRVRD